MSGQQLDPESSQTPETAEQKLEAVWSTLLDKQKGDDDANRIWPSYDAVLSDTVSTDYNQILKCPFDFLKRDDGEGNRQKVLGPHGVVCQARLELFPNNSSTSGMPAYTGALQPGTTWPNCLFRLSSAMQPPNQVLSSTLARSVLYATGDKLRNAQLFPMAALKVFLDDADDGESGPIPSRNLLSGGSKIGQREKDFFAHCQCTSFTERMPLAVKPFARTFYQYSKYPLSLGVSDFCKPVASKKSTNEASSDSSELLNFPFAIILKPRISSSPCSETGQVLDDGDSDDETKDKISRRCSGVDAVEDSGAVDDSGKKQRSWSKWASFPSFSRGSSDEMKSTTKETGSFDTFLDFCLNDIPAETHLYDVYACPSPQVVGDPSQLQRIGRIISTSTFLTSSPDDGLFFKHQSKEEDYALKPDWPEALQEAVTALDGGKVKGTVGSLAGWKLFQQQIAKKRYIDFEQEAVMSGAD